MRWYGGGRLFVVSLYNDPRRKAKGQIPSKHTKDATSLPQGGYPVTNLSLKHTKRKHSSSDAKS